MIYNVCLNILYINNSNYNDAVEHELLERRLTRRCIIGRANRTFTRKKSLCFCLKALALV